LKKTDISTEFWNKISLIYHLMLITLGALAIATAVVVRTYPTTHAVKLLIFYTLCLAVAAALVALGGTCHNKPKMVYPVLFFAAFIFIWLILGSKIPDSNGLRSVYVSRLKAHENVRFMRGGETDRGVDGIGLAKASFWQAMIIEGLRELNPHLFGRNLLDFWFADLSLDDLINRASGYTNIVDNPPSLVGYDSFNLDFGDMAVTTDASDIMIYTDKGQWVYADRSIGKVRVIQTMTGKSVPESFKGPVIIVRWWLLDTKSSNDTKNGKN